nr:protein melted [Onthophagus taurus]
MNAEEESTKYKKMQDLFFQVLKNRDLSRAGDLFSIPDAVIVNDLTDLINEIIEISSLPDYAKNDNDQSVVEICVTRVTSCVRETGSVEKHCEALVKLLESCLHHNLQVSPRGDDPPHAKISSDVISCLFLNYSKKSVMQRALPVAVKFLHKGNKELSRNMASYISLAAIDHASLLSPHVQPIMDSIISGNYPLCRVLAQIYEVSPEPLRGHAMALVTLLPHCDNQEKLSLLDLFSMIAKDNPALLEASVPQLCEYLNTSSTASGTLQIFVNMSEKKPAMLSDHLGAMKQCGTRFPQVLHLVVQVIASVGKLNKTRAQEAYSFMLENISKIDRVHHATLMRGATLLCTLHPALFSMYTDVLAEYKKYQTNNSSSNQINQIISVSSPAPLLQNQVTSGQVTIVRVGETNQPPAIPSGGGYTRRAKLGDSRSTGRLHTATNTTNHRSMTRLNIAGGSVGGLHSMTRLSSSQQINAAVVPPGGAVPIPPLSNNVVVTGMNKWGIPNMRVLGGNGVTVTTISQPRMQRPHSQGPLTLVTSNSVTVSSVYNGSGAVNVLTSGNGNVVNQTQTIPVGSSNHVSEGIGNVTGSIGHVNVTGPTTVTSRRMNNTSVTLLNAQNPVASQRVSVFEPYPMRDTIQHFCEKHLEKIKTYMENVSVKIPPPVKCTIEEKRQKKSAKLHFVCQARGQHCLYSRTSFHMRTRNPRIWIHLMFIALQAKSPHALSSRDPSVTSLKHCWDMLKCENKTFLTVVTSAFPCTKDQDALLNELRHAGFFDVFQVCPGNVAGSSNQLDEDSFIWGCFLCAHPERAVGFLRGDTQPVIEGQLKEKKGRWRLFRRWRTRYFTLSGAHLSCRGSSGGESIDVNQIQSVKVSRGARNIPKAFEIFTGNQTLILKPKDGKNAEEWVQCLSIVVAHSHAKEVPAKSNSLPGRSIGTSRTAI